MAVLHPLHNLSCMPSIGALLNTTQSRSVLDAINAQSGGGVCFGQQGNPYAERYMALREALTVIDDADRVITRTVTTIKIPDKIIPVTSIEEARVVPPCMYFPILTYGPVRKLFEEGKLYGYNIDPKCLPEEDDYGRMIKNGTAVVGEDELFEWEWRSTDPRHTDEELKIIDETRKWFGEFLEEQLAPGGDRIDPTSPDDKISL